MLPGKLTLRQQGHRGVDVQRAEAEVAVVGAKRLRREEGFALSGQRAAGQEGKMPAHDGMIEETVQECGIIDQPRDRPGREADQ